MMSTSTSYFRTCRVYSLLLVVLIITTLLLLNKNTRPHSLLPTIAMAFNRFSNSFQTNNSFNKCLWKFDHYSASTWEMYWYNNITNLQNNVCSRLTKTDQIKKSIRALEQIIEFQKTIFNETLPSNQPDELFSQMFYRLECSVSSPSNLLVSQYIEPLIGLLRDPLTMCTFRNLPSILKLNGDDALQSKRFFLLGPSAPYENFQTKDFSIAPWLYQPGSQRILFDVGSSYFDGWNRAAEPSSAIGTRWFYEYFLSKSIHFDRIIAFEAEKYIPKTYWNQIPDDLIGLFTFINVGVEKTGKFNPWNILKSIAKTTDYVIIKLDIDTPIIETELMDEILNDPSISSLIDEMFFEMHVTVKEMIPFWGTPPGELKDTYRLFTELRQLGIRMHSWP